MRWPRAARPSVRGRGARSGPFSEAAQPLQHDSAAGAATGGATQGGSPVRNALALMGGMLISTAGVGVVVGSDYDLAGVLLIGAGVLVAALGMHVVGAGRSA
jgi:hypothetical protein